MTILQGLEKIPWLKEELQDSVVKIAGLEKEVAERNLLLLAARRGALEYKDKLRVSLTREYRVTQRSNSRHLARQTESRSVYFVI